MAVGDQVFKLDWSTLVREAYHRVLAIERSDGFVGNSRVNRLSVHLLEIAQVFRAHRRPVVFLIFLEGKRVLEPYR